jgi:glutaconate CoA-transferase, subunit B
MAKYAQREIMAICAGRLIEDGNIVFGGTGISMLAATVAKRIHAPGSVVLFETGGIDPSLDELPLSVADGRVMVGTSVNTGLADALTLVGNPRFQTIAFLGAAQIDKYGNLNSTCIGNYHHPKTRFPGSGGACDALSTASATIVFMTHDKKRFVETLDYRTSPGWLTGGDSRKKAGLKRGGPLAVVTTLGLMKFDDETKEMYLAEYYPGITPQTVVENTGFHIDTTRSVPFVPPTDEELRILTEDVDPQRLILGPPA